MVDILYLSVIFLSSFCYHLIHILSLAPNPEIVIDKLRLQIVQKIEFECILRDTFDTFEFKCHSKIVITSQGNKF